MIAATARASEFASFAVEVLVRHKSIFSHCCLCFAVTESPTCGSYVVCVTHTPTHAYKHKYIEEEALHEQDISEEVEASIRRFFNTVCRVSACKSTRAHPRRGNLTLKPLKSERVSLIVEIVDSNKIQFFIAT